MYFLQLLKDVYLQVEFLEVSCDWTKDNVDYFTNITFLLYTYLPVSIRTKYIPLEYSDAFQGIMWYPGV